MRRHLKVQESSSAGLSVHACRRALDLNTGGGWWGGPSVEGTGLEDAAGLGVLSCVLHFKQARETVGSAED